MTYPVFRCLANHLVYYRIENESEFTELKITGNYYSINTYYASQYPEKLKIRDMILNEDKLLIEIDKNEFNTIKYKCEIEKKLIAF